jgi:hypothetical protein
MTQTDTTAGVLIGDDRITETSAGVHDHLYPATGMANARVALAGQAEK